ncbi:MAG: glutaredoxin family protein [Planctomycetia bacterium]|nr:glutaredoxin family protein [Planctomycetia bacterium]
MHRITLMVLPNHAACAATWKMLSLVLSPRIVSVIEEIDITTDPELLEKYRDAVPVLLVDGQERFRNPIDPDALARSFNNEFGERFIGFT